jgi:hypothetical protein
MLAGNIAGISRHRQGDRAAAQRRDEVGDTGHRGHRRQPDAIACGQRSM